MTSSIVRRYHDATKHHFHRFARSLGYLDWSTQPNPFRRYAGAPRVELWRGTAEPFLYDDLYSAAPSGAPSIDLKRVSLLLRYSMGLSAWKQYGSSRWALRVNPSSGNLHPTEVYVVARTLDESNGWSIYHYAPDAHEIEQRFAARVAAGFQACRGIGDSTHHALVGVSTIHWREAWKYGERAFRYCQHDTGHAIATVALAARMFGWETRLLPGMSTTQIASLLGLNRNADFDEVECEEAQCVMIVGEQLSPLAPIEIPVPSVEGWCGAANQLSRDHVEWPIIDTIAAVTRTSEAAVQVPYAFTAVDAAVPPSTVNAADLILQRRSALAFDGESRIDRETFVRMMMRAMPAAVPPWNALWWAPRIHLALFVHRVDGIEPGLYFLVRNAESEAFIRAELQRDFEWTRAAGVPDSLPLFCLARGDCRRLSARLSCDQTIASDGFFSLGMIAEFEAVLDSVGPWFYRHLFWESGVVGQVLYLEAEAAGARATGIGCFYDEPVHETLGIFSHRLQSLYHFTVGMPVEDSRLTTEPGYVWESRRYG